MKKARKVITDGLEIIDQDLYQGKPDRQAQLERAKADEAVARKIYALRTKAGLTQRQLAKLVGTTRSVISRLEDADYEGHSLAMLNRIAAAMDKRVEIRFVPEFGRSHPNSTRLTSPRNRSKNQRGKCLVRAGRRSRAKG